MKESGVLLNIDVCFKVLRDDTCLAYLNDLLKQAKAKGQDG